MHGLLNRLLKPTLHQRRGEDRRNVFPPSSRITMESRSLVESLTSSSDKPTSLSFESHSSSRDRPHPGLRSFQRSRFLHPFSSRFYPSLPEHDPRLESFQSPFPRTILKKEEKRKEKNRENFSPYRELERNRILPLVRGSNRAVARKEKRGGPTLRRQQCAIDIGAFWAARPCARVDGTQN